MSRTVPVNEQNKPDCVFALTRLDSGLLLMMSGPLALSLRKRLPAGTSSTVFRTATQHKAVVLPSGELLLFASDLLVLMDPH